MDLDTKAGRSEYARTLLRRLDTVTSTQALSVLEMALEAVADKMTADRLYARVALEAERAALVERGAVAMLEEVSLRAHVLLTHPLSHEIDCTEAQALEFCGKLRSIDVSALARAVLTDHELRADVPAKEPTP